MSTFRYEPIYPGIVTLQELQESPHKVRYLWADKGEHTYVRVHRETKDEQGQVVWSLTNRIPIGRTISSLQKYVEGWIANGLIPDDWLDLSMWTGEPPTGKRQHPQGDIVMRALAVLWCAIECASMMRAFELHRELLQVVKRDSLWWREYSQPRPPVLLWFNLLSRAEPADEAIMPLASHDVAWTWMGNVKVEAESAHVRALEALGIAPLMLSRKRDPSRRLGLPKQWKTRPAFGLPLQQDYSTSRGYTHELCVQRAWLTPK